MRDRIIVGDTLDFVTTFPDYASATWTCTYYFVPRTSGTPFSVTCTAGTGANDFRCAAAAATTALWVAGEWSWSAVMTSGAERYEVDRGTVTLLANPATATAFDGRSHARKALDAIEAVLENRATLDQEEYSIGGRSLKRTPATDLIRLRSVYLNEVRSEDAAKRLSAGMGGAPRIMVRF
jgi:hypothetical protein